MRSDKLSVIDIFCGAGGFSEGFREQGFDIVMGIDSWDPAVKTFNHNFGLDCQTKNVLDFQDSIEEIEELPDTDVIIGSPPCVSFSSSNKSGKADKSKGVILTEIFLRIVAVKKHKPNSILKGWFMENVVNSIKYLNAYYTFEDLNLSDWAKSNSLDPNQKAIILEDNQSIVNSADYGSPQVRRRVISGEIIKLGKLEIPKVTHCSFESGGNLPSYLTLSKIKNNLPQPKSIQPDNIVIDPFFNAITLKESELTDHFYDTGLYEWEWKQSRFLKINHPYMGRMSFPENEMKPSRTITATKIGTSRESIIYKSEYDRKGDGEYRTLTVREAACLMGFPITYQFIGSEGVKHRLVGNAVCTSVSKAFAAQLRLELNLEAAVFPRVDLETVVDNLNTFSPRIFDNPPKKNKGSRFRRHPFKVGNLTVTLSNYDIVKNEKKVSKWKTSVQYGNGVGFPSDNYHDGFYESMEHVIKQINKGDRFLEIVNNGFSEKIGPRVTLQKMYEIQQSVGDFLEPTELIEELGRLVESLDVGNDEIILDDFSMFTKKLNIPVKQVFALYAINKIASIANSKKK